MQDGIASCNQQAKFEEKDSQAWSRPYFSTLEKKQLLHMYIQIAFQFTTACIKLAA